LERRLSSDITGSNSQRSTGWHHFGLDHKLRTTVLPGDEIRTLFAGAAEGLKEMGGEPTLFSWKLQHIVPYGVGRRGMSPLAEMEAILREESSIRLPGARTRKVLELRKRLNIYRKGLK